jgi:DNA-directed RNA polymerase subunit RPC12/RpoP
MDAPLEGLFLPCGHMAACMACGQRVMGAGVARRDGARCPICGAGAHTFHRVFVCAA